MLYIFFYYIFFTYLWPGLTKIRPKKVQKRPIGPKPVKKVRWQVWHIKLGCLWAQKPKHAFWSSSDQKTKAKIGQRRPNLTFVKAKSWRHLKYGISILDVIYWDWKKINFEGKAKIYVFSRPESQWHPTYTILWYRKAIFTYAFLLFEITNLQTGNFWAWFNTNLKHVSMTALE